MSKRNFITIHDEAINRSIRGIKARFGISIQKILYALVVEHEEELESIADDAPLPDWILRGMERYANDRASEVAK